MNITHKLYQTLNPNIYEYITHELYQTLNILNTYLHSQDEYHAQTLSDTEYTES